MRIPFLGLMLIIVKNIFAGVSDIVIKDMTNIDPVTLIFFRSTVMLCLEIPWSLLKDQPPFPPGLTLRERVLQVSRLGSCWLFEGPGHLLFRCVLAGLHVLATFFALQQMPLSVQKMILSLKPVFTMLFERIFLKVSIGVVEVTQTESSR